MLVPRLAASGADALMIGRAARGRPWLPGQIARSLAGGRPESAPALSAQLSIVGELYEEMLEHHGLAIGRRHARKHLGWALDAAAEIGRRRTIAAQTIIGTACLPPTNLSRCAAFSPMPSAHSPRAKGSVA